MLRDSGFRYIESLLSKPSVDRDTWRPCRMQILSWVTAFALCAAALGVWRLRARRPSAARQLPTEWALTSRPVFSADERSVHRLLREALPQHIVPFYLKPTLTRHERVNALNRVAGSLTTDEVAQLTEDTRRTREPHSVAEEWLTTSRFATG